MSYDAVNSALDAYLQNFLNVMDVAWEGTAYTPQAGRPYLSPRLAAYTRTPAGLGEGTLMVETGSYAINVNWPVGQGKAPPSLTASALVAYFNRHVTLTLSTGRTLTIEGSSAMPASEANGWLTVPVMVRWLSDEIEPG
ncbi:phage tail terminator-like protein [Acidiphilium angustum]|uniref:phage tail terminator-like protein n=1 Tax=Acidiphilium angustum TaxID=523 RepID=UPI000494C347|nr:phage tail terminator-like protein [Acidiphilium angustum]